MANRNAILDLKAFLQDGAKQIQATVGTQLTDEKLLQQMILEVAGRSAIKSDEPVEVILPTRLWA